MNIQEAIELLKSTAEGVASVNTVRWGFDQNDLQHIKKDESFLQYPYVFIRQSDFTLTPGLRSTDYSFEVLVMEKSSQDEATQLDNFSLLQGIFYDLIAQFSNLSGSADLTLKNQSSIRFITNNEQFNDKVLVISAVLVFSSNEKPSRC